LLMGFVAKSFHAAGQGGTNFLKTEKCLNKLSSKARRFPLQSMQNLVEICKMCIFFAQAMKERHIQTEFSGPFCNRLSFFACLVKLN
jgi:hypothetical protein